MAKANPLTMCSGCGSEIPHPIPEKCVVCGRTLHKPENPYFAPPDYLVCQLDTWKDKCDVDTEKPPSKEQEEEFKEVTRNFSLWVRDCPFEDKDACLRDALLLMRTALVSKVSGTELQRLVTLGKSIGTAAAAVDGYMKAGGGRNENESSGIPSDGSSDGGN